jgi:hypothetical protein
MCGGRRRGEKFPAVPTSGTVRGGGGGGLGTLAVRRRFANGAHKVGLRYPSGGATAASSSAAASVAGGAGAGAALGVMPC